MIFSIIEQAVIAMPLILGAYLTISLLKLPDFSIESAYLFGAVTAFIAKDLPLPLVLLSAIGGGMFVGMIVCFFNQILHIPYLLAAIVTNGLFHGITQYALGKSVEGFSYSFPIPEVVFVAVLSITVVILVSLFLRAQLGYSFAIYGNNPQFFSNHRISSKYVVFGGILIGHGLVGLSGFLFAQSTGFVDLTMNYGVILMCLTALMIGKLLVNFKHPNVFVPILGILAFFLIQQSLLRVGLNLKYFNTFQAVFVLAVLLIGQRRKTLTLDHLGV
jgi:putative ABC transport system permease protein